MRLAVMTLLSGLACAQVSSSMAPINSANIGTDASMKAAQSADITVDPNSLLPSPPVAPKGKATLIGGTISNMDRVRDQITVRPFGGRDVKILFDGRTQIVLDGNKATSVDIKPGSKVYVDTVLDGNTIFAKNIRVVSKGAFGQSRGQIVTFDRSRSEMTLNDGLNPQSFKVKIMPGTKVIADGHETSTNALRAGTLVAIEFSPSEDGAVSAQQISILAQPGTTFTFIGKVMFLDLHKGMMSIIDPRDKKSYDVYFNPSSVRINGDLQLDSEVTVNAAFDGNRYATSAIMVNNSANN
ncbi:MAG TPA: DUF5666 domain-containing protein [Terriglobales bacterium]|nr:DUF5666 domain-containing protein [Terriglobales bacterium]